MRNRSSLYAVIRIITTDAGDLDDMQVVGVYSTLESCDEKVAAYNQQVQEGKLPNVFLFDTQITTYYDE